MIEGECFCGSIKYKVNGELKSAHACHCSRCRKAFSGASSAYAELGKSDSFIWLEGENNLQSYKSKDGWGLIFCKTCGSTLCGTHLGKIHGITLGSVNGDPGVDIAAHLFVGSKAPWDHIGGSAPQYLEWKE